MLTIRPHRCGATVEKIFFPQGFRVSDREFHGVDDLDSARRRLSRVKNALCSGPVMELDRRIRRRQLPELYPPRGASSTQATGPARAVIADASEG